MPAWARCRCSASWPARSRPTEPSPCCWPSAGGIAAAVNSGTDFSNVAWTNIKAGTGIIVAVILLVSYFFGGYVAGRMARRSGVLNGIGVFVLGVVIALAVGVLAKQAGAGSNLTDRAAQRRRPDDLA